MLAQIIAQTAKFVREAAQIEFVLRVKQASNPNFSFLLPQDRLHSYFRWLVNANPEGRSLPAAASSPDPAGNTAVYGTEAQSKPTPQRSVTVRVLCPFINQELFGWR